METLADILRIIWYIVGALAVIGGFIQFLWYAGKFPAWAFSVFHGGGSVMGYRGW